MTHTKTPWRIKDLSHGRKSIVGQIFHIIDLERECSIENAEFIVKAVNCHDELLEALEIVIKDVEWKQGSPTLKMLKSVVKKAKGESC